MKINSIARFALVGLVAVACSKESDPGQSLDNNINTTEARIANSFVVGTIDDNGQATITYPLSDLGKMTCCQLLDGTGTLGDARIERIGGVYHFRGIVRNEKQRADFAYKLTREGQELVYEETNSINACTSSINGPACTLNIQDDGNAKCTDAAQDCKFSSSGPSMRCEWPWMVYN